MAGLENQESIGVALFGFFLLILYLTVFTIGSQVSSAPYSSPKSFAQLVMLILTLRESSIPLLGMIAGCLGTWRRRNQDPSEAKHLSYLAYISACIGGLVMSGLVVGVPSIFGEMTNLFELSRSAVDGKGQQNFTTISLLASFISFLSGYDTSFFDRVIAIAAKRLGVGPT